MMRDTHEPDRVSAPKVVFSLGSEPSEFPIKFRSYFQQHLRGAIEAAQPAGEDVPIVALVVSNEMSRAVAVARLHTLFDVDIDAVAPGACADDTLPCAPDIRDEDRIMDGQQIAGCMLQFGERNAIAITETTAAWLSPMGAERNLGNAAEAHATLAHELAHAQEAVSGHPGYPDRETVGRLVPKGRADAVHTALTYALSEYGAVRHEIHAMKTRFGGCPRQICSRVDDIAGKTLESGRVITNGTSQSDEALCTFGYGLGTLAAYRSAGLPFFEAPKPGQARTLAQHVARTAPELEDALRIIGPALAERQRDPAGWNPGPFIATFDTLLNDPKMTRDARPAARAHTPNEMTL